jgi:hypothetical protein
MLTRLYNFFSSVKLAVVLLAFGLILVFWGTIAQVKLGLYQAQNEFFRSLFIYWKPGDSGLRIPIFPGGYLVGGLLVINLFAAHLRYYQSGAKKLGIAMIHLGVVMLLLGQFATDVLSVESYMKIREGEAANYSESNSRWELAIVDTSDEKEDKVVAIPAGLLATGGEINHPELPFKLRVKTFYRNSQVTTRQAEGFTKVETDDNFGGEIWWRELPHFTQMNQRDIPSGIVEMTGPDGQTRRTLITGFLERAQLFGLAGKPFLISLRPERYYKPFSLHLIDFRFDRYPGTEIPKNFSSRVRLEHPATGEKREVTIRMNEPLRFGGETFFQADWDKTDEKGTVLQVVRNPGWLTPYLACVLVSVGMIWQFMAHLLKFAAKQKTT